LGDPKKKRKRYTTPKRPYDVDRLREELRLIGLYGLRNKRELWKHRTELRRIRRMAREMLALPPEERAEQERQLMTRLRRLGLIGEKATLEDVLGLRVEDILERRLQTIVYRKGLARSPYQARQLIVHGHIAIGGQRVRVPSYLVEVDEEDKITYAETSPLADENHPLRKELEAMKMVGEAR